MGDNEKTILRVVLELIGLILDRQNTGADITDEELDEALDKAKKAKERFTS